MWCHGYFTWFSWIAIQTYCQSYPSFRDLRYHHLTGTLQLMMWLFPQVGYLWSYPWMVSVFSPHPQPSISISFCPRCVAEAPPGGPKNARPKRKRYSLKPTSSSFSGKLAESFREGIGNRTFVEKMRVFRLDPSPLPRMQSWQIKVLFGIP